MNIKICGVTRPEDASLASELGAFAVGMILSKCGPRFLELDRARKVRAALGEDVFAVGVFVDETAETINRLASELDLDLVQLHGSESPELIAAVEVPAIKSLKVSGPLPDLMQWRATWATLVEGAERGKTFDWNLVRGVDPPSSRLILAGGLTPENVADAAALVSPFAVDVSSGVEKRPGEKDPKKLKAFFDALA